MHCYQIFFSPKDGVASSEIIQRAHKYGNKLMDAKLIVRYEFFEVTNPANFEALPRFQMISYFETGEEMEAGMQQIGERFLTEENHQWLMKAIQDFKVSFIEQKKVA